MSQLAAHMQKFKIGNLGGLQRHDERTLQHPQARILMCQSLRIISPFCLLRGRIQNWSLHKQVRETIADERVSNRAVRKDAVVLTEWVISSDSTFLRGCRVMRLNNSSQTLISGLQIIWSRPYPVCHKCIWTRQRLTCIWAWYRRRMVRLSAKTIFNREALRLSSWFTAEAERKGWNIERGERGSKRQHLSVERYKEVAGVTQARRTVVWRQQTSTQRVPIVNMFNFVKGKEATQNYILPPEDYQRLTERVQGFSDLGHVCKGSKRP